MCRPPKAELSESAVLVAGCSLLNLSIKLGPKLALTVHKVSAGGLRRDELAGGQNIP